MHKAVASLALLLLASALGGCAQPSNGPGDDHGSGIQGIAMMGPTCPVERDPPDPGCADRPYQGQLRVTRGDAPSVTVTMFSTGPDGKFNVSVAPGTYHIQSPEGRTLPYCSTQEPITVAAGKFTQVDVDCDTGIR